MKQQKFVSLRWKLAPGAAIALVSALWIASCTETTPQVAVEAEEAQSKPEGAAPPLCAAPTRDPAKPTVVWAPA